MKKTIIKIAGAFALPMLVMGVVFLASGDNAFAQVREGLNKVQNANTGASANVDDIISKSINFALMAIAIVSVFMLILGGFKYTPSNGDSAKVTSAKNTIMYSLIGLLIAIFAYAIVNFVVNKVTGN